MIWKKECRERYKDCRERYKDWVIQCIIVYDFPSCTTLCGVLSDLLYGVTKQCFRCCRSSTIHVFIDGRGIYRRRVLSLSTKNRFVFYRYTVLLSRISKLIIPGIIGSYQPGFFRILRIYAFFTGILYVKNSGIICRLVRSQCFPYFFYVRG